MTETPTILVPIRYPLTAASTQTLLYAKQLADTYDKAELVVLHVNLFQNGSRKRQQEIARAISPLLEEPDVTVLTRSGFLVEETIVDEALISGADLVVVGKSQKSAWRRLLSQFFGNEPAIESHLRERTTAAVEVAD